MPRTERKGTITIHFPENFYVYINGIDYTDYVLSYEFREQQNVIGEFTVDLAAISSTQRTDVARGNDVQLRFADNLIFKGYIERADYGTDEFCKIRGYGATETRLKNAIVKQTYNSDDDSSDGRPSYGYGTISGVSSQTIVDEQISGVSNVYLDTNDYLGHVTVRSEYDNVLSFLDDVARSMSGVWWSSYGSWPYTVDYFNVARRRGTGSSVKSFAITGADQNANRTSREVDEENLWTSVTYLGYGDGVNQIKSRVYHATDNFTKTLSGCTGDGTIITVEDTTGFRDSSTQNFEDWESVGGNTDVLPAQWTDDPTQPTSTWVQDSVKYAGTYSLRISGTGAAADVKCYATIPSGHEYSCWMRMADTGGWAYFYVSPPIGEQTVKLRVGINDKRFVYLATDLIVVSGTFAHNDTWYKCVLSYESQAKTADVYVLSGATTVASISKVTVPEKFTPSLITLQRAIGIFPDYVRSITYFDNVAIEQDGIWVGSEKVTYTGRTSSTFTGCTRAAFNGTFADQKYLKKYAHSPGVAVWDMSYTEDTTDGNSKIDSYGLKQKALIDKKISDQDVLDRAATNALIGHYEPVERIGVVPSDMYDCLKTVGVGDVVTVTDSDSGLSGLYIVIGQLITNSEGVEELSYELENVRSTFTQDLRAAKDESKVSSQFMQGSTAIYNAQGSVSGSALEVKLYLPGDIKQVDKATVDIKMDVPAATADLLVGPYDTGKLGTVSGALVSGSFVDISDWIVSGITLADGNWMLVKLVSSDPCTMDALVYVKCFVEAK